MLNVVIDVKDKLFQLGIEVVLKNIYRRTANKSINFSYQLIEDEISDVDVIVRSVANGELHLCQNVLYNRAEQCLVIIVCEDSKLFNTVKRSLCLTNAIFIDCSITPKELERLIEKKSIILI